MREFDKAIADVNEAMRLVPGLSADHVCRGYYWQCKQEHDKALADFNEAIRLDPWDCEAYTYRGDLWRKRKISTRPLPTTARRSGLIR